MIGLDGGGIAAYSTTSRELTIFPALLQAECEAQFTREPHDPSPVVVTINTGWIAEPASIEQFMKAWRAIPICIRDLYHCLDGQNAPFDDLHTHYYMLALNNPY